TLWSGSIGSGDTLQVEPSGRTVRVRSVQVHDAPVERAEAGQRVAVNLPDLDRRRLARGDVLVEPGHYPVSFRLNVRLQELTETPAAVTVHVGTKAVPARLARKGEYAQLRLAEPVVAARGDRVVLRTNTTVAGGTVLDPAPPRHLDPERLAVLERGDPQEIVRSLAHAPVTGAELQVRGLLTPGELAAGLAGVESAGDYFFARAWLDELAAGVRARLAERARTHPLDPGVTLGELLPAEPWAPLVVGLLGIERRGGKGYLPGAAATLGEHADEAAELEARLASEEIVKLDDRTLAGYLEEQGRLRRVGDGFAVSPELYERGRALLPGLP